MKMHRRLAIGIGAAAAVAAAGTGVAVAVGGDNGEGTVPATAAAKAEAAALKVTGGGKVTALELDNENGATYEVELTKPDGASVDVRLDAAFTLVGQPEPNTGASESSDGHADDPQGGEDR